MDDTRPTCNEPNCCGQSFIKNDPTSIIKEICYKSTITLFSATTAGVDGAADTTDFWKFTCIEGAKSLAATAVVLCTSAYMMN